MPEIDEEPEFPSRHTDDDGVMILFVIFVALCFAGLVWLVGAA